MAQWTKREPLLPRAPATPKLNTTTMNPNILRKLIYEPLQILACLLVLRALTLKMRIKTAYLSLKVRYLSFKCLKLVASKRKLLAEYRRRTVLRDQLLYPVEDIHVGDDVVMPNEKS
jgi:hypothetical protein